MGWNFRHHPLLLKNYSQLIWELFDEDYFLTFMLKNLVFPVKVYIHSLKTHSAEWHSLKVLASVSDRFYFEYSGSAQKKLNKLEKD